MKKTRRTTFLLLTALVLTWTLSFPAGALSYRKGANTASASYRAARYYAHLSKVPLTGDGRSDVLAVALSQLGYQEGGSVSQLGGTVGTFGNFTEFNYNMGNFSQGYGGKNYPWCASFVSFCLYQARVTDQNGIEDWCRKHTSDPAYLWYEVSCKEWAAQLRRHGYFRNGKSYGGGYRPRPADLIFFTKDGSLESHVGLVLWVEGNTVYTVEGNTSSASGLETNGGGVYIKSYGLGDPCIRGYGAMPYRDAPHAEADPSGKSPTAGIYITATGKYVYSTATATAHKRILPRYSMVAVLEVAENGRLRVACELDGQWIEGYVLNNSDRVIQLYSYGVERVDGERYELDKTTLGLIELPPPESPTEQPTEKPTEEGTEMPTEEPMGEPTGEPTDKPMQEPIEAPSHEEVPSDAAGCRGRAVPAAAGAATLAALLLTRRKRKDERT